MKKLKSEKEKMKNFEQVDDARPFGLKVAEMADDDKPREKAMKLGLKNLSYVELIAIALGSGLPGKSVIELSREILAKCENKPARLATMTVEGLCRQFKGVGPAKAITLLSAIELGMRVGSEQAFDECPAITTSADVVKVIGHRLKFLDHEEFWVLLLDRRNRVRAQQQLSAGGMAATVVDPKLLFRYVLENGASGIIVVHNHPSGNLRPSAEDDRLTRRLKDGAALLDIRMLDHVIIAEGGHYSYMDNGKL